eukprot:7375805-Prymnesium_polylepis.1
MTAFFASLDGFSLDEEPEPEVGLMKVAHKPKVEVPSAASPPEEASVLVASDESAKTPEAASDESARSSDETIETGADATLAVTLVDAVPTRLTDLPDDLLGWIFSFISMTSLVRDTRAVCHAWYITVNVVIDTYDVLENLQQAERKGESDDEGDPPPPETPRMPLQDSLASLLRGLTPRRTPTWSPTLPAPAESPAAPTPKASEPVAPNAAPPAAPPVRTFHRRSSASNATYGTADAGPSSASAPASSASISTTSSAAVPAGQRKGKPAASRRRAAKLPESSPQTTKAFVAFCAAQADLERIDEVQLFSPC